MAINNFTKEQFEAALPVVNNVPLWVCCGLCQRSWQYTYKIQPFQKPSPFSILVYSSIKESGVSSSGAGGDSIRAMITYMGKPYGSKSERWIARSNGWRDRLMKSLRKLANQIRWLALHCPNCGSMLVPFTAWKGKAENKGRGYVCCTKDQCVKEKKYAWEWTETLEGELIPPPAKILGKAQQALAQREITRNDLVHAVGQAIARLKVSDVDGALAVLGEVYQ